MGNGAATEGTSIAENGCQVTPVIGSPLNRKQLHNNNSNFQNSY